jgi:ATP-dependent Clp protease ATP-binding subunit ClpA
MLLGRLKDIVFKNVDNKEDKLIKNIFLEIIETNESLSKLFLKREIKKIKEIILEEKSIDFEIEKELLNEIFKRISKFKKENTLLLEISEEDFVYYVLSSNEMESIKDLFLDNVKINRFKKRYLKNILETKNDNKFVLDLIKEAKEKHEEEESKETLHEVDLSNSFLNRYAENLSKNIKRNNLIGRSEEKNAIYRSLKRKNKSNPLIIGEQGTGKTELVNSLAFEMQNKKIYKLDTTALLAGAKYRGDLEERLNNVFNEMMLNKDSILFIDDLEVLLKTNNQGNQSNVGSILKPYFEKTDLKLIGTVTAEGYRKLLESDKSADSIFTKIKLQDLKKEEVLKILEERKQDYEKYHSVAFPQTLLLEIIELSEKHMPEKNFPEKALDLLDDIGVLANEKQLKRANFNTLKEVLNVKLGNKNEDYMKKEDVLKNLENNLNKKIIGQEEIIKKITESFIVSELGLIKRNRPENIFLFLGSTGVGKTELVNEISHSLTKNLIRIDMSEYSDKMSLTKLIGSSSGYVGYEEGGVLSNAVKERPDSIVLLDEIDKADQSVLNMLLQVFDNGFLNDGQGNKINFKNTTVVMTGNIGLKDKQINKEIGFLHQEVEDYSFKIDLKQYLPLEFINRIDEIFYFNYLSNKIILKIIENKMLEIKRDLLDKKIKISYTKGLFNYVLKNAYDKNYGARKIGRFIESNILTKIAKNIVLDPNKRVLNIEIKNNEVFIK